MTQPRATRASLGLRAVADQWPACDQRPPEQTDDSGHGHANPYAFWSWKQIGGCARVYQQMLNNVGYPQWSDATLFGTPLPGDAASVAPAAIYGLRRLVAAYNTIASNFLLRVQFADATTYDVPQLPDGRPDQGALWKQATAHGFPARVAIWYDQSGNGYNATQATAANQPLLTTDRDGDLVIVYDEWVGGSQQTRSLTISTGLSLTQNAMSAFSVGAFRNISGGERGVSLLQLGNTGGTNASNLYQFWTVGVTLTGHVSMPVAGWASTLPSLAYFTSSPSGCTVGVDGYPSASDTTNLGANTITGGVLGMTPGTPGSFKTVASTMGSSQYMAVVFASTLSAADVLAVQIAVHALGKTTPQARFNVLVLAESIAEGYLCSNEQNWVTQLAEALPKSLRVFNFGVAGQGIGSATAGGGNDTNITAYPQGPAKVFNAHATGNIAIINGGNTNDWWNNGGTPSITVDVEQGYINALVADLLTTGFSKVFVLTPINRNGGSTASYTYLANLLASILTNAGPNNYTPIRLDLDPALGTYGASANSAAMFVDGTHPTPLGDVSIVSTIRAAIAPFVVP